ncbi:MAG: putative DNA binding domain-containing protein [Methylomonas sp.]|nr:putative DNA binding domain-containing protein [Methylomonas sp.]PPD22899.1 MAG: transcriptional regulator [Methylomonas sp.]PPD27379.1 MAG: transcriptional regulator [Methylomonas sp.]PPD39355.1 MAG: transcriptional regulator [Methylomonas sp.]PPD41978.1 MAG: transcriptional regulator [Methylomonas sp.]
MQPFTDDQLHPLLTDLESDRVERKESLRGKSPEAVREAVCAFANDLAGHAAPGVVLIGVRDDGTPMEGFAVTDELLRQLADIKTDGNIVPPPSLLVERRLIQGRDVAVITVWPCDTPPVRYKGRIHVRWGPRRGLAVAQDERILNERRRHRDKPFDIQPVPSATLAQLSRVRFEHEYLPALVAPDVIEANERSYEQKLAATKMIVDEADPIPTVLGLLTLGNKPSDYIPGAYGQFLRFRGTDAASEVLDEATIQGTVSEQIRRMEEKLAAHNVRRVRFVDVQTEQRHDDYPAEALHQLVRNAYLHRSYENTHAPVRVYWFDDRIEISNPGGPYGSVTIDNFGQPGLADYRNPNLAESMRALGWVQRFGAGIVIARKVLGARLSFDVQATAVIAKIRLETT